jgi:hypothetical protein
MTIEGKESSISFKTIVYLQAGLLAFLCITGVPTIYNLGSTLGSIETKIESVESRISNIELKQEIEYK